jgi:hypothetical protein
MIPVSRATKRTVQLLRDVKEHADRDDVEWLTRHGKVYVAVEAA